MDGRMDGWNIFNVEQATEWAFAHSSEVNPKADPETIGLTILIFRKVASPSL